MLARHEQGETYTPFVAEPIGLEASPGLAMLPPTTTDGSVGDGAGEVFLKEDQTAFQASHVQRQPSFPWPFPSSGRPHNDLTRMQTLTAILALTIGLGIAALVAIALVDQLTRLRLG